MTGCHWLLRVMHKNKQGVVLSLLTEGVPTSAKIPLDQEQYTVLVPLVGEYLIHQPLIVFGIAEVIVSSDFPLGEYLVVVLIEWPQTTYVERRVDPSCF